MSKQESHINNIMMDNGDLEKPTVGQSIVRQEEAGNSDTKKRGWYNDKPMTLTVAVLLALVVCLAVSLGVVLGLHCECSNEANDQPFQVTLSIQTDWSNSTRVGASGESSTTWYFPYYLNEPRLAPWFLESNGRWFDSAVRIQGIDTVQDTMDVQVYLNSALRAEFKMQGIYAPGEVSAPACTPQISKVDLRNIPIGSTSESFALGTCIMTRQGIADQNTNLEPRHFTLTFRGTVTVKHGWDGSSQHEQYPW